MILRKTWQRTALWLGIGWSLWWSVLLSELPLIQHLDLSQSDRLIRLNHPRTSPPEIVLVTITEEDLKTWGLANEPIIYSNLVNRLLDAGAAVVVLNLLPNWVQTSDRPNNPIETLVQRYSSRIVLVLPTSSATQPNPTEWRNYEYFLPLTNKGKPLFSPQSILGFAEYEPEAKYPQSVRSTARQANLSGQFTLTRNLDRIQPLDSAALLTLKKFKPQQQPLRTPQTPIQIHFWGATGTFPTLEAQSVLSNNSSFPQVGNKIVLVGFSETNNPDAFAVCSPFGELMPAVELQANLLASLLTGSFYQIVPIWLQKALIVLGGILISQWIVFGKLDSPVRKRYWYWLYPVLGLSGFSLVSVVLFGQGWILPITLLLATWTATGVSVFISLLLGVQKDSIDQQQCEIDRLHSIEQAAAIFQAKKMLRRIAANIHEGPLQELKLVMDRLEILQCNIGVVNLDPILERLENLGHHLRQQLNQARAITLEITPELKAGLDAGIRAKLQQLVNSGELTLRVVQQLQPLQEPESNSLWLEAREDIYHFFCEAINNVIRHAQLPHGTATEVQVSLCQQDRHCTLTIENDGAKLDPSVFELSTMPTKRGGFGMKLMKMIASELPNGILECVALPEGGMRVQLSWNQAFNELKYQLF
ncbi:MAG: CHASE2 domain-containing protein [Oscillatoriaceae cyanobacterium Prado104]|jgi:CHASE2 domain-containing sensor protein|nr:CHASE2 domain-containing protein [Oscillatoriaceae cyanobacterium Prado104]